MDIMDYKDFYERVGIINGWDFSRLQVTSEGETWDFYQEVRKRCNESTILLDIGTGGGEKVLSIASMLQLVVGIDLSSGMIETARANSVKANVKNVLFHIMPSNDLRFPTELFDVVSCNHAPFDAREVAKVLKDSGPFLTQQVSEGDKWNIKQAFGRGQSYGEAEGTLKESYIHDLKIAGFSEVDVYEYDAIEYYQRPEDLIFLLIHTPIIPGFGELETDMAILHEFITNNRTEKGIRTNSKRFMLVAYK